MLTNPSPWIAIVDDQVPIRRALLRLMRAAGIEAEAFSSGAAFIDASSGNRGCPPCCVVLDLHMPEMSGFDVQAWLVANVPEIDVIMLTGQHCAEVQARAMVAKPLAYFLKPVDDRVLLEAIALSPTRRGWTCF